MEPRVLTASSGPRGAWLWITLQSGVRGLALCCLPPGGEGVTLAIYAITWISRAKFFKNGKPAGRKQTCTLPPQGLSEARRGGNVFGI